MVDNRVTFGRSHLLQMRGLKPERSSRDLAIDRSHLLQMRGLKPSWFYTECTLYLVASFTDAWIETGCCPVWIAYCSVASFTDAWIETIGRTPLSKVEGVASFTDAWIETAHKRRNI